MLIKDSITVINNKETDTNNILPEINLNSELKAPISKGDTVGTIKYIVDDIEYTSDLLAGSDCEEKPDYSSLFLILGISLLVFSILILPKKHRRKKSRKRSKRMY